MSSPDRPRRRRASAALVAVAMLLGACTAGPLYTTSVAPKAGVDGASTETREALASIHVVPVTNRAAQAVRNELIFLLSRGRGNEGNAPYELTLTAYSFTEASTVADLAGPELAPTSSILTFVGSYRLTEASNGRLIGRGERRATAALDTPRQPFAEQRARLDGENRAARELAALLAAAVAADLATGRNAAEPDS